VPPKWFIAIAADQRKRKITVSLKMKQVLCHDTRQRQNRRHVDKEASFVVF
jgi:hypothetical protein